jgi:glycosyltransferase involved in cell wall biosynthesis
MRNRIYYYLKPILPKWLRLAARRVRAQRLRRSCAAHWPIYEAAGGAPQGWPGWPEGKQFAFVLTHDVERIGGVERCRELAELEMEYGFRSCFNFIPQSDYQAPVELLNWLRENGFEIGVHDLFHDGKLFNSRESFSDHASAINRHLKNWGAVGFRAGFMLHQLDWLHDLNIAYDSSSFDVDPFEPQSDGAQTIFPFWITRPNPNEDAIRNGQDGIHQNAIASQRESSHPFGYMELPSTMVQDYSLFVVLKERSDQIWRQKVQWIAEKGGMALMNVHPDYTAMKGERPGPHEFPVEYYRSFLEHVRSAYAGRYWHALPREVAAYCRNFRPPQARPPRKVVMLTHSFYDSDNRIRRYAETLAKRGDDVRVFCLGAEEEVKGRQWMTLKGVQYLCLQSRKTLETGQISHIWRLVQFWLKAYRAMNRENLPRGCDLLHVHNIPDFLVFAGLRLKRKGAKVILDIHDIVPELYESKFGAGRKSTLVSLLRRIEQRACRFSDHVIVANHLWKETLVKRSAPLEKATALVNNVDLDLFAPRERGNRSEGPILIYPGTLNYHQGLDLAIKAVALAAKKLPGIQLRIYGRGQALPELKELAMNLGLTERVHFQSAVPLDKVGDLMAQADIGIVPKRAEGFGDQAYSTKIMELMSQKLPVIVSRTRIDRFYFNDSVVAFFESGNHEDLAEKICRVAMDADYRESLRAKGYAYAKANCWDSVKHIYLNVVDRLTTTSENYCSNEPDREARTVGVAGEAKSSVFTA